MSRTAAWLLACALACAGWAPAAAQGLQLLSRASAEIELDNLTTERREVRLPLHWDAEFRGAAGRARFTLDLPVLPQATDLGLLMPRVGNSYEVRFNGQRVGAGGDPPSAHDDHSKRPRYLSVPRELVQPQHNRLEVLIDAQSTRKAGLSPIILGPAAAVQAEYASQYAWRVTGARIVAGVSGTLGLLALLLWSRHRGERLFLIYGASELLWALSVADTLLERTPLPWPWWGVLVYSAQALSGMLICRFALIVAGRDAGALRRCITVALWCCPLLLLLAVAARTPSLELLVLLGAQAIGLWTAGVVVHEALRSTDLDKRVLAAGMLGVAAVLLRDAYVLVLEPYLLPLDSWAQHYGNVPWMRYAWLLFGFVLAWIVAERLRRAAQHTQVMHELVETRLAAQHADLQVTFRRQSDMDRTQARLDERERLTRDMHDGLGLQLLGALQMAQNDDVPRDEVARQVRATLDHLKLTVDAMQDTEGDIASLLGALRHRLAPRMAAAGVQLEWSVPVLPAVEGWTIERSRDLQMILFEAFSNVCSHARASHSALSAQHDAAGDAIDIVLHDNGVGLAAPAAGAAVRGHGLANMKLRAQRLGAGFLLASDEQGTRLSLRIPLA